jgi:hypothetical protein
MFGPTAPSSIEHTVPELVAQRIYALALGYEDLNDHDQLRQDPLLAVLVGKEDPTPSDGTDSPNRPAGTPREDFDAVAASAVT